MIASKHDIKNIIKMLRFKLITSTTGTQDEYLMKNNFRSRLGPIGVWLCVMDRENSL